MQKDINTLLPFQELLAAPFLNASV